MTHPSLFHPGALDISQSSASSRRREPWHGATSSCRQTYPCGHAHGGLDVFGRGARPTSPAWTRLWSHLSPPLEEKMLRRYPRQSLAPVLEVRCCSNSCASAAAAVFIVFHSCMSHSTLSPLWMSRTALLELCPRVSRPFWCTSFLACPSPPGSSH